VQVPHFDNRCHTGSIAASRKLAHRPGGHTYHGLGVSRRGQPADGRIHQSADPGQQRCTDIAGLSRQACPALYPAKSVYVLSGRETLCARDPGPANSLSWARRIWGAPKGGPAAPRAPSMSGSPPNRSPIARVGCMGCTGTAPDGTRRPPGDHSPGMPGKPGRCREADHDREGFSSHSTKILRQMKILRDHEAPPTRLFFPPAPEGGAAHEGPRNHRGWWRPEHKALMTSLIIPQKVGCASSR
jgi:hypothetical protein